MENTEAQNGKGAIGLRSLPKRQILFTMAGVVLAMFLASLDQTIVGTAMPRIVADLGGFAHYTWLTTAYLLTSTVVLPITGKVTDMYGRKPFFIGGIAVFVLGSVFSGLSHSMVQIILARGFQGIGAGVIMANAFSVIGDLYPPAERGMIQGVMAAVFGLSSIVGPFLGGWVTDAFSWHWIFYINVPLGVATVILFLGFYPHLQPQAREHSVDLLGVTALLVGVVPLLLAVSLGGTEWKWGSPEIIGMFILSAIGIVAFPLVELRAKEPIIPMTLFQDSIILITLVVTFISGAGMFGGITFVPLFFQGVLGKSATSSGTFLTPMMLGLIAGSAVSGQLLSRTGRYKIIGCVGLGLIAVGLFLLSRMTPQTSMGMAVFNIVWIGAGLGVVFPILTIVVQNTVPYEQLGAATATVPFFRAIGGSVGLAMFGAILNSRFASSFVANVPADVKTAVPPQVLDSVSSNAQALLNPDAQTGIAAVFQKLGQQGATLYQHFMATMKLALSSALSEVFLIGAILVAVALLINLFIKEIPLKKSHTLSSDDHGAPPGAV